MKDSGYYSDELSDTNFEKAEEECRLGQHVSSNNKRHNHVIKVVNKKQRSKKVSSLVLDKYQIKIFINIYEYRH